MSEINDYLEYNSNKTNKNLVEEVCSMEGHPDRFIKRYNCVVCGTAILLEFWDKSRCFGIGSVLKDNKMPEFCPKCGTYVHGLKEVVEDNKI